MEGMHCGINIRMLDLGVIGKVLILYYMYMLEQDIDSA